MHPLHHTPLYSRPVWLVPLADSLLVRLTLSEWLGLTVELCVVEEEVHCVTLSVPEPHLLWDSVALPVGQALPLLLTLAVPEVLGQAEGLAEGRPVPVVLGLSEKVLLTLGLPEGLAEELRLDSNSLS